MPLLVKHVREHKTGRLDYRRTIPPELRPFIPDGKTNFVRSLGEKGSPGLLSRYEEVAAEYAALEAWARKQRDGAYDPLDSPTIAYLVEAYRSRVLAQDDKARWHPRNWGGAWGDAQWGAKERQGWARLQQAAEIHTRQALMDLRAAADTQGMLATWTEPAVNLASSCGYLIDPKDEAPFLALCRGLNDAAITAKGEKLRRLRGEDVPTPPEPERPAKKRREPAQASVPLMATFEAHAREQGITAGVRYEWGRYHKKLIAFLGHDDLARLTADDVIRWKDHLLAEPTERGGVRSAVTVNDKYLTSLKATLNWAVDQRKLKENVAARIRAKRPRAAKLRERHFTDDEAKRILAAALVPAPSRMAPEGRLARRWVPWLCAYTGARVGEMAQLRGQDVQEIEGVWTLRITPEAGTVKTQEARVVPIHEHLIAQGFLKMIQDAGEGPIFYDPTRRRANSSNNRHIKKVGQRLAEWVRNDVGITNPGVAPNHGWRHTFKSRALEAGIAERTSDAITGHAPSTEGQKYTVPTLKAKADAIALYPRYDVVV